MLTGLPPAVTEGQGQGWGGQGSPGPSFLKGCCEGNRLVSGIWRKGSSLGTRYLGSEGLCCVSGSDRKVQALSTQCGGSRHESTKRS